MALRMRTAQGALEEIKRQDPDTAVTLNFIRGLIAHNKIPVVCAGRKKLVDVDQVIQKLSDGTVQEESQPKRYGEIRRVSV